MNEDLRCIVDSPPKGNANKAPVVIDWRDKAIDWFEWVGSGFVGMYFSGFALCQWDLSIWILAPIGVAVTVATHGLIKRIAERYT